MATFMTDHGPSSGILAQLGARADAACEVEVWAMYPPPPDRDPTAALKRVNATYVSLGGSHRFVDPAGTSRLVARLRHVAPDILHAHLVRANVHAGALRPLLGNTVVVCTARAVERYMVAKDPVSRLMRGVERRTQRNVSRYVSVSRIVRDAVTEHLGVPPSRSVAILNAVDLAPFASVASRQMARARLGIAEDAIVVGTVGVLEPRKNLDAFIAMIAALHRSDSRASVVGVIIGDGPERARLQTLARSAAPPAAITFTGPRKDVAALLPAFDVFALTSSGEGLPRAVMEAMATGIPCVVYDVGGNREAVMDGREGFVHAFNDEAGFVGSVRALIENTDLRRAFGSAARAAAFERFSPRRLAREYDALYEDVLDEARRAG